VLSVVFRSPPLVSVAACAMPVNITVEPETGGAFASGKTEDSAEAVPHRTPDQR
jgi:hypothetical protein